MKTKLFTLLLAVAASIGTMSAYDVVIPDNTRMGTWDYMNDLGVTSVIIGNNCIIEVWCFYGCSNIQSIVVGDSCKFEGRCFEGAGSNVSNMTVTFGYGNIPWNEVGLQFQRGGISAINIPCDTYESYTANWSSIDGYCDLPFKEPEPIYEYHFIAIEGGSVTNSPKIECDNYTTTLTATPNNGYHFTQWSDGVTDNPRTVVMTKDTTFIALFAHNPVVTYVCNSQMGRITGPSMTTTGVAAENITFEAIPNYGYHFTQWSDGNTDNPRTIWLSQDTTMEVVFAKNTYTISTGSSNPELGTTSGSTSALYLDEIQISATPNYGYHFDHWNDGNTSNPRTITVTEDKIYTATFAKNIYEVNKQCNGEQGSIIGVSQAEYLDYVTLTAVPNYGYHFTQWSDGLKDNPRIFVLTQDTTFTAEFTYNRVGTCGKDLALVWSYDPANKVLTIGNAGSFTENMQFGVEAPNEMEELVIGNSVTAIGANAFAGISSLKKVSIGESVKTIGEQAFFNCVNLETIFNYRPTPTNAYSNAFDGVDKFECALYVLSSSIDMYKNASVWRDFYYTYAIGAEEATVVTNDVQVEPQDNAATVTWPTSENAASYTIQITKDGVVFCTLIFNGNGQLTGIAFAPSRDGQAHAPAAIMTANGLQFTVTGLDSGTHYDLTLQAKDSQNAVLASYSSNFTTTGDAQGIEDVLSDQVQCTKILHNGQIFILRGEKEYTLTGQEVK